ncbi:hypothetical protein [Bacillus pinisoli]|uniref:hypothetical protein n=1 Tax=Bacillus pinisoli TaxID=2901866 RepID=UPI001FF3DD50|nr:hypothetical protein [Bacillus pinisoli]
MVTISFTLLILIISVLVYRGMKNGSMQFTVKKFVVGVIITIVFINGIMFFMM